MGLGAVRVKTDKDYSTVTLKVGNCGTWLYPADARKLAAKLLAVAQELEERAAAEPTPPTPTARRDVAVGESRED